jgi:hypothetical protein
MTMLGLGCDLLAKSMGSETTQTALRQLADDRISWPTILTCSRPFVLIGDDLACSKFL